MAVENIRQFDSESNPIQNRTSFSACSRIPFFAGILDFFSRLQIHLKKRKVSTFPALAPPWVVDRRNRPLGLQEDRHLYKQHALRPPKLMPSM